MKTIPPPPSELSFSGQECLSCCKRPSSKERKLLKCTACRLAYYCDKNCQKTDWKEHHKNECKVLILFRKHFNDLPGPPENITVKVKYFWDILLPAIMVNNKLTPKQIKSVNKRRFMRFVYSTKVCCICYKNEFFQENPNNESPIDWKHCSTCRFGWCCSDEHWQQYNSSHHTSEVCQKYQDAMDMAKFHYQHILKFKETFLSMPQAPLTVPPDSLPATWDEYFLFRDSQRYIEERPYLPKEFFPANTNVLSQVLTCLYAMYKSNWSCFLHKEQITIHVAAASSSYEVPPTCVWEEILHFLPRLQSVTVHFIGPEACQSLAPPTRDFATIAFEPCPDCTAKNRKRRAGMFGYTYHDYATKYLASKSHSTPDLVVAFNTGMHEEDTESWKQSLQVILDLDVPAFFTSYNAYEARLDYDLLQEEGAKLLQDDIEKNPFRDEAWLIEPANTVVGPDSFHAQNMYGVLFKGRTDKMK